MLGSKSGLTQEQIEEAQQSDVCAMMGRSYYIHCLEFALVNVRQARMLVKGDVVDDNHDLPTIEALLQEAVDAS
jgi:hypothetical protein